MRCEIKAVEAQETHLFKFKPLRVVKQEWSNSEQTLVSLLFPQHILANSYHLDSTSVTSLSVSEVMVSRYDLVEEQAYMLVVLPSSAVSMLYKS